jgi:hypothetical protein
MIRLLSVLFLGVVVIVVQGSGRIAPAKEPGPGNSLEATLPVGKWKVDFTNGVVEVTDIFMFDSEGHATVDEPLRKSRGRVVAQGSAFVLTYNDDRTERWTPVGKRFVVEHWFPGSRVPTGTPVLGIAERKD